jgi:NADH:ubiquinone oxidoreductase subunit 5 (subunit L)/multisubunit Na+/H+ antiporter MnhA subunit
MRCVMFVGWEGVGLASYLLIGFYFKKDSAANAGKKAFIVNRIGDFGFLIGMFLLLANFGTLTFSEIATKLGQDPGWQGGVVTVIALCLLLGATGKSAQLPLYIWLPDAMEGPTPVSALIHAATMVTAGVYMIARTHVLFDHSPFALGVVAIVGAATALFAATIGLVQNDIKRVLAYSTISQLGYMFLGCGVAAYSAAIFHLMTHAFFKALLFLGRGFGDSRHRRRAGPAQDGRAAEEAAGHFLDDDGGSVCHCGISAARCFLLEGRDSLRGLSARTGRDGAVVCGPGDGAADLALHVPALVSDVHGRGAQPGDSSA